MKRFLVGLVLAAGVVASSPARADGIDGLGHVSVGGGFRWVPNWWFQGKAADAGTPMIPTIDGGPQANASFGLGVTSYLAASINLLGGYQAFQLSLPDGQIDNYSSTTFGALLGGRLAGADVFFKGFMPYLELQAGPIISVIGAPHTMIPERVVLGLSAAGGISYRFLPKYGVTLEVRYLAARNSVPDISGINVGGVWFSAMFTMYFPPSLKRDSDSMSF
ncbi:MAG: hypothetical protein U0228_11920 [Myxococcaceae bacterium]